MKPIITQNGTEICKVVPARCNVFIVSRLGRSILIDTGMHSDRWSLKRALLKKGFEPKAVILTHSHFDHAGNAAWLKKIYGAEIVAHVSEREYLEKGDMPIPEGTLSITKGLVSVGRKMPSLFNFESCSPDIIIDEFMDLSVLGFNGFVMHTPGHSQGEVAIVIDDEIAFAGDSIIGTIPGKPFPPFADNINDLLKSWGKLLDTKCRLFLPGHGRAVSREVLEQEYRERI